MEKNKEGWKEISECKEKENKVHKETLQMREMNGRKKKTE